MPQDTDNARLVQKMDRLVALRDGLEGRIRYAEETMGQRVEESRRKVNRQVGRLIEIRKEAELALGDIQRSIAQEIGRTKAAVEASRRKWEGNVA